MAHLERENAELRTQLEQLRRQLEEWKRGYRERPRRRSSRPERKVSSGGAGPGRPAGFKGSNRPVPERIDRVQEHAMPEHCTCGGKLEATGCTQSTVVQDLPPVRVENVRHIAHEGRCRACGKKAIARLPAMSALGEACSHVQLGPRAVALALTLHIAHHVSRARVCELFRQWFDLSVSEGALSHLEQRWQHRTEPAYAQVEDFTRNAPVVGADETGWRQANRRAWVWIARTAQSSLFRIEPTRAAPVIERMLGEDFAGVLVSDFYGAYTCQRAWNHAYCGAHLIREAKQIAEVNPNRRTLCFSTTLRALYAHGTQARQADDVRALNKVRAELWSLAYPRSLETDPELARLRTRLRRHFQGITLFLDRADVPADNNGSERDLRPLAVHRNVTGCTQSEHGSRALAHWMSVTQTLKKQQLDFPAWITAAFHAHFHGAPTPSVLQSH